MQRLAVPVAVWEVAVVDLLGIVCSASVPEDESLPQPQRVEQQRTRRTVELVPVQMLGSRVALAAALVRTLELLVESLPAPPPLPRTARLAVWAIVARVLSFAATPSRLCAVRRRRGGRLAIGASVSGRVHVHALVELGLAQLGRCLHLQDLRHRRVVEACRRRGSCRERGSGVKSGLVLHGRVSAFRGVGV